MNNLMKQAQKMQRQMEENQKALEEKEFTAAAGGGPLVMVQQMIVRSEDDIRRISQELYNLIQTGSRAQGRFSTA